MAIMVVIDLAIVLKTGSIQGSMIYAAALGIALYLFIRSKPNLRLLKIPYALLSLGAITITVMGLSNKGPLSKFLCSFYSFPNRLLACWLANYFRPSNIWRRFRFIW